MKHILATAVFLAALISATGTFAAKCPDQRSGLSLEQTQPLNVGQIKLLALEYKCFGDYDRDVEKALSEANAYVTKRAGEVSRPALVLDIDETSLSNWPQILANDFGYIPNGTC